MRDIGVRLAHVGLELAFGVLLERFEHLALLQLLGEEGDLLQQLLPRKFVAQFLCQQQRAEDIRAVLLHRRAGQLFVLLLNGLAALFAGRLVAELVDQRIAGVGIGRAGVVGRGARHAFVMAFRIVRYGDCARFEE